MEDAFSALLTLRCVPRWFLFSARLPADATTVWMDESLILAESRNSQVLHFFFAAAIVPSGNVVESGYDSSNVRRPIFPEEMTPLESGLDSSGGASFCIAGTSFLESGPFGD